MILKIFFKLEEELEFKGENSIVEIREILFDNVSFKYSKTNNYVLKNINMKIQSGKSYALVGENGAGKSTIVKLLLKLFDDYEGKIFINGKNIREIDIRTLNSLYSVVFQDFAKYEIEIRDNITLGNNTISDEYILETLTSFKFDVSNYRFKNGLSTELGRLSLKNTDLSLRQWQKIALARAVVNNGKCYILDEPTSSLDPISETETYFNFRHITKDNTSIIITHRLGAAKIADEILVIDSGTIVERGSHEELISRDGLYKKMYFNQKTWYEEVSDEQE